MPSQQHRGTGKATTVGRVLVVAMLVVGTCLAVDRGKFRTCSQSAFCARNRPTATPPPQDQQQEPAQAESPQGVEKNAGLTAQYALGEVVEKSGEGGSRAVWASLVGKTERPLVLGMNVAAYGTAGEAEILRFTMSEERDDFAPVGVKRFGVGFDSQLASSFLTLKEDLAVPLSVVNDKGVFRIMAGGNTVATLEATLKSGGFTLNVTGAKNHPVVSLNSKGQFVFEHLREKLEEPQKPLEQPEQQKEPEPEKPAEDIAGEVVDEFGVMFENEEVRPEDEAGMLSSDNKQPAPTGTNEGLWSEYFGGHTDSKPHGPTAVGMDISFPGAKHVYGIPEHAAEFDLKTTTGTGSVYNDPYRMFNLDVFEYIVDDPMALYGSIPLMIAHSPTHSVGVLWLNPSETWVDVADGSAGKETWWISESGIVDVFILRGPTPKDIFEQVAALLGTTPIPPLFALGYHQCRWNYKDEPDVKQVDNDFDKYYIPYDVIWLDIEHTNGKRYFTWDEHKFPTPELMQDHLASKGRKLVTIVDPHIKRDSNYWIHTEATEKDLYVKDYHDNAFDGHCWPGSSSWPDFINPTVRKWWGDKFSLTQYKGSTEILHIWNDMNEPSVFSGPEVTMPKDNKHYNNLEHRDIHNLYGLLVHMSTYQGLLSRNSNERPFVLTRAFFAGSHKTAAVWIGDTKAEWGHLKYTTPMLLSLSVTGMSFGGGDVGGFFYNPDTELLVRWYEAGAYQPFFRGHSHIDTRRREPWLFGDDTTGILRNVIHTRYQLLPLWYTLFHENYLTGMPVMRPLWVEFPQDESAYGIDDSYMIGNTLLVSPVVEQGVKNIDVYLPDQKTIWYDVKSYQKYLGGQLVTVDTPLDSIPVFMRGGTIIPKKERLRRATTAMTCDPYTLVVALDSKGNAQGELYADDGHTMNYASDKPMHIWKRIEFNTTSPLTGVMSFTDHPGCTPTQFPAQACDWYTAGIERIVIVGLTRPPQSITSPALTAPVTHNYSNGILTLRQPFQQQTTIAHNWSLHLAL